MLNVSVKKFEDMVQAAFDALPVHFRDKLRNVEIVVKDSPDAYELDLADVDHPDDLLGFYDGIPLTERSFGYDMTMPDVIYIYRRPPLLECNALDELQDEFPVVERAAGGAAAAFAPVWEQIKEAAEPNPLAR